VLIQILNSTMWYYRLLRCIPKSLGITYVQQADTSTASLYYQGFLDGRILKEGGGTGNNVY
jgi:hypothetical protein